MTAPGQCRAPRRIGGWPGPLHNAAPAGEVLTAKQAPHRPNVWDGFQIRPTRHRPGARSARRKDDPRMMPQTASCLRGVSVMRTRTRTWRPRLELLEDRCLPSTFAAFDL